MNEAQPQPKARRPRKGSSLWRDAMRYLLRQRSAIVGMIILGILVLIALLAPLIAPYDPVVPVSDIPAATGYRFTTDPALFGELVAAMDKGEVSADLRAQFQANGLELTPAARLEVKQAGSSWIVVEAGAKYFVRKERKDLKVYDKDLAVVRSAPCIHLLGCSEDSAQYILGLDSVKRDLFSRVIYGSRYSLYIGFVSVGFAIVIGALIGAVAAYAGGWVDNILMRIMDVLMAFPSLMLAIAIVSVLGPGLVNALLAIGIVSIPSYARVMRASVLSVKERDFVVADRALGFSPASILFRRIVPNALAPMIVQGTLGIATAILNAAALSFLGLGAQKPMPEWGIMLGDERSYVFTAPHLVFFPGLAIMLTVLAFNLLGDGLRDALDPRLNR